MKRFISILLVFVTVLSFAACSGGTGSSGLGSPVQQNNKTNEEKGVPQKQLEAEVYPESTSTEYTVTSCTHDVDTSLHQDTITLKYSATYKYMRTDYVETYVYQYNRATDLWTKVSSGERNYNYTLLNNLKNAKWEGVSDAGFGLKVYYNINVDAINTIEGWIQFSYHIYFADKEYSGTKYMKYGEFTLTQVENMFRITFSPNEGISVSRN